MTTDDPAIIETASECPLCGISPCDPEIDAATERIHAWLRSELAYKLADAAPPIMGDRQWMVDIRMVGYVPQPANKPPQKRAADMLCEGCGVKPAVAVGYCRRCYDQRRGPRRGKAEAA